MKKYNVIDLYVIEKNNHKFICEYFFENEYIEVLTKEKIKVNNKEKVERFVEYISILERICLESKKPLKFTKKAILLKYLEINKNLNIDQKEKNMDMMINMWQEYVESVKDDMPDIPIINARELNKQKTLDKK